MCVRCNLTDADALRHARVRAACVCSAAGAGVGGLRRRLA
jgi:hypothetical protein